MSIVIVIMGVSGSGKTTVGKALAKKLDVPFYDGDDFHPPENVTKMANGEPLDDDDRYPWLVRLHDLIADHLARGEMAVVACSALKEKYRDILRAGSEGTRFVYLSGSFELIWQRLQARHDHYMKAEMLQSQFESLDAPSPHDALIIGVENSVESVVDAIIQQLDETPPA